MGSGKTTQVLKASLFVALASTACLPGNLARAEGQTDLMMKTDQKNRNASDSSMQSSTTYAMTALMDLASLNVTSAVNNGMTAYGKYRNSETLDKLGDMNVMNAASMGSIGNSSGIGKVEKTQTSFRRLGTGFLKEGPAAQVAAEFEKRSGMSREKFMEHLSSISEKKISRNDPQLVDKVLTRFEGFIADIPNPEFKGNLQKAVNAVPATVRTGLIGKAVSKFASVVSAANASSGAGSDISVASAMGAGGAAAAPAPAAPSAASSVTAEAAPAADTARLPAADSNAMPVLGTSLAEPYASRSSDAAANPLGNVIQDAIRSQDQAKDITIFQQVSRVYKNMAGFFSEPGAK